MQRGRFGSIDGIVVTSGSNGVSESARLGRHPTDLATGVLQVRPEVTLCG